ncbi:amino acid adenylation domain-containing protein [Dactylosporangium sp. NPDC048998]|uniref:amino acid adenylation domain-containing protein n=1 Tax=Dactylosporangium sp. NPDC048998 TaxID=3363976 RepID=UPI0037198334
MGAARIPARADRAIAPLSFAQSAIWRAEQLLPDTALHNETAAYRIDGPLDVAALQRALSYLTGRYEMMRCAVATGADGEPRQHFAERVTPAVHRAELDGASDEQLSRALRRAAATAFDLSRPPLVRTHVFRLAPRRHVVLFVAHHFVVDAWAFRIFLHGLADRYAVETGRAGTTPTTPPGGDSSDFSDYAAWQRGLPEPDETHWAYWRERLDGDLPVLSLPHESADAPAESPAARYVRGDVRQATLPRALVAELTALGRTELATLPAVVLTGFAAVLSRYAGQDDLVVGVPAAVRGRPELAGTIGPLLNLVAHRVDLTGTPTFREALRRVRDRLRADLRRRDVPFDLLVERIGSGSGRTPLFQTMYAFHSGPPAALTLPGTASAPVPVHSGTAKYDVSLFAGPAADGGLHLRLEYRTALLAPQTAEALLGALARLLTVAVADPHRPLADVDLLGPAGRHQLLVDFNRAGTEPPPAPTVPGALRALAAADGAAPAVTCGGTTLTRAGLGELADRVAGRLAGRFAVRPGDRIAVLVRRDARLVALILGVWRAGAVLVPLDEALPAGRREQIIGDSGPCLTVTDAAPAADAATVPVVALDALTADDGSDPGPVPFPDGPAAHALAYLMYTSGSTGAPKGVAVRHDGVLNVLSSVADEPGLTRDDVLVAVTSITFDISILELFAPLVAGGRVVVGPDGVGRDPVALGRLLHDSGASVMQATPSLWRGLLDGGWAGRPGLRAFCGGEALEPELARRLLARCAQVWNLYGPTETTIWSTAGRIHPDEPVTVGRPVARTVCYILGRGDRLVPRGAVGELVIGGAGVTAGYWRRPELTAAAFVADPVDPAGGTVYRTGDLARHLPDGRLVILGRRDQQVKINGHRVELGEIEAALLAHPAVRQAAVLLDRAPDRPRLVAFVVPSPDATDDPAFAATLRRHLAERLAAAVVPPLIVCRPELPLNVSGKVDRPALARIAAELGPGTGRMPPVTAAENAVAAIWASVLGAPVERVGSTDDFLAAGGNSIAATRLLAQVEAALGRAPSLAEFYREPTVAALARALPEPPPATPLPPPLSGGQPAPAAESARAGTVPLTDQQRQFWLLHRLAPESAAYHLAARVEIDGPLDPAALADAFAQLGRRHPVLTARCELAGSEPLLVCQPDVPIGLELLDLRGVAPAERPGRLAAQVGDAATRPFDLDHGPLLRAVLVRETQRRCTLLLAAHHIAVDGWSVHVAARELARLYDAAGGGSSRPGPLAPPRLDFVEYAADPARAAAARADLAYWTRRLDGYSGTLNLPVDPATGPRGRSDAGRTLPVNVGPERTVRLREVAARLRVTPFTVLLSVFAALLGRYAGTDDVVVGVPAANRGRPGTDEVVGLLMNTLPVRVGFTDTETFAQLAARVAGLVAADLGHALVPFDRLVAELNLDRDLTRPTLAQAMLVFQPAPPQSLRFGDAVGTLRPVDTGTAKYELTLALDEHPDRLAGRLEYAAGRFDAALAERFLAHFDRLLAAALADPNASLDPVDLGGDPVPSPAPAAPPGLIRDRAGTVLTALRHGLTDPDRPAIRYGTTVVRYGELDRWSDRIAAAVIRAAQPAELAGQLTGRFVSVLLPTGPEQTAAIIGIAKAGAAFAVLDPADPEARLDALLRDAEPVCVLATEPALSRHPRLWDPSANRFGGVPVLPLPTDDGVPAPDPAPVRAADPLCLVYTSGSTGLPKGIVLSHASFAQFARWQAERFGIGADSRVAQWAPFTYDAAYTEVFAALTAGATLCVPPVEQRRDPVAMVEWLRAEGITQLQTVPAFFALITDVLDATGTHLPELAHVLLAGEVLPVSLTHRWADRSRGPRLHNLYGPTECILASHRQIAPGERFTRSVPIGVPIPGRQALVLDHRGRPCPVGVTGEIHLRSDLLAGSYHRRQAETERAYRPDPWQRDGRLYRTGDLGRYLPSGELDFVGRTDSQVKIRGNRVELGAIEALLEAHPLVVEAAAAVHGDLEPRLVGYAVAAAGVTGAQLREHLAAQLPAAAVPETVVLLDAMPRTGTNKRDRSRLPVPDGGGPPADAPPGDGLERLVADVWQVVLDGRTVGRHTNFFDAGGDSLRAARLQVLLTARLRRQVRLVDIFARPTVAEFAAGLDAVAGTSDAPPADAPHPDDPGRGSRRRAAVRAQARRRTTG